MKTSEEPIVVEQSFNVPREMLWKAITEHDRMLECYFEDIPEFTRAAGVDGWTYFINQNLKEYLGD